MKKKRKYTKKMHIYRTKQMLKSKRYYKNGSCPAAPAIFKGREQSIIYRSILWSNYPCAVCQAAADIGRGCPCIRLGEEEAIRRLNDETLQRKI